MSIPTRGDYKRGQVITRAWKDPAFKERLLKTPKAALKECGCQLPDKTDVKVVEEEENTYTFLLPKPPANLNKLSEADLAKIAAGFDEKLTEERAL